MVKIQVLEAYKDIKLDKVMAAGEEYEVTEERYNELKVLEPRYLVGTAVKTPESHKEDKKESEKKEETKPVTKTKRTTKKK